VLRRLLRSFAPPVNRGRLSHVVLVDSLPKLPLTKVAGKLIANFLRPAYCQCGDVYPSILTESRPAGLVMAVTDF
jgi:hypothetical protein